MAFGISGFGASQTSAAPQVFQALSLAGQQPRPPAPPFGSPNENLVPVSQTNTPALPANLTLAAHPAFTALLRLTSQTTLALTHPAVSGPPFTTSGISATNPAVTYSASGPVPPGIPAQQNLPAGPVSFTLTVPPADEAAAFQQTQETLRAEELQGQHAISTGTTSPATAGETRATATAARAAIPPVAASHTVARIVATIKSLAVSAVYPAPVFSLRA